MTDTDNLIDIHRENDTWVIANGLVERRVSFESGAGLYTQSWVHKLTSTDFVYRSQARPVPYGPEFAFLADGVEFAGASDAFDLAGYEIYVQDGRADCWTLEIRLTARQKPLAVSVFYSIYAAYPVIRKWLAVSNTGADPIRLHRMRFETLPLTAGPLSDLRVAGHYGVLPREIFLAGRVDDTAVVQENALTGEGLIALNEAPGYTKRTEMCDVWGPHVNMMYDTDLFPFERWLAPGETFTTARSSILFYVKGQGYSDPWWLLPTFTTDVLLRKGRGYQPPWIYNTWEPFQRAIDEQTTVDLIEIAGRMGLDIFTIDDGWQLRYGENDINLPQFPGGLDHLLEMVEAKGMRLGLWIPLAAVALDSQDYREHPEWQCHDYNGQPKMTMTMAGPQAVMCLATPYRHAAAQRLIELISRYRLQYVKLDLTTIFNAYGEAPGCWRAGHEHGSWAESLERIYAAMSDITRQVYAAHPDVLLDLTYELWGHKHILDYGLLASGDLDWLSNVQDHNEESAGPRQARQLLYHRALALPVEAMLIGNLQANTRPIEERFATTIGSGPLFAGDLRKLTAEEQEWYREKIAWFKQLRAAVPLYEGFFPLGNWLQPDANTWDGFARLSRQGEGLIVVFRNKSAVDQAEVQLPVPLANGYHVTPIVGSEARIAVTGDQLRRGIWLPVVSGHPASIWEIRI